MREKRELQDNSIHKFNAVDMTYLHEHWNSIDNKVETFSYEIIVKTNLNYKYSRTVITMLLVKGH